MIARSNVTLMIAGLPLHLIEICNATLFQFTRTTHKRRAKDSIIVTTPAVLAEGLGVVADSHEKIHWAGISKHIGSRTKRERILNDGKYILGSLEHTILVLDLTAIYLRDNLSNTDIRRRIYIVPQACDTNPCIFSFVHPTHCIRIAITPGQDCPLHVFLGFIPPNNGYSIYSSLLTIQNHHAGI